MGILFLPIGQGFASDTRIVSMGNANALVKDYYNITIFPSAIIEYPNHIMIGFGGNQFSYIDDGITIDEPFVGSTFGLKSGHTFGLIVGGKQQQLQYTPIPVDYQFDLFYGKEFGAYKIGLKFHRASGLKKVSGYADATSYNNYEQSVGENGVTVGIGMNVQDTGLLETAISYNTIGFKNERGNEKLSQPEGYKTFAVESRVFYEYDLKTHFIPYFLFQTDGMGRQVFQQSQRIYTETETINTIILGLGINHKPTENMLLIGGLAYVNMSSDSKLSPREGEEVPTKGSVTYLPMAQFGFETQLKSWIFFRCGMQKLIGSESSEEKEGNDTIKTELGSSLFGYSVGLGIHVKGLMFDFTVDQDFLKRGPYLLSGASGKMFPRATLTYIFQ